MVRRAAVFVDVGGPIYPDENFLLAAHAALNQLREARGLHPVAHPEVRAVYDRVRNSRALSLRGTLAAEFLGHDGDRDLLHQTIATKWIHPAGSLYPDVLGFFGSLRGRVTTGILANQEVATVDALSRDGVAPYIDVWGISATVGVEKPAPEFFEWALRQADVEPHCAVHVGNRFTNDVLPAHHLGMKTIWLLRGEAPDFPEPVEREKADLVVDTLDGLAPKLFELISDCLDE